MKQIVAKNGRTMAVTTVPYPPEIVKQMKKAGYQVKEVKEKNGK